MRDVYYFVGWYTAINDRKQLYQYDRWSIFVKAVAMQFYIMYIFDKLSSSTKYSAVYQQTRGIDPALL